MARPLLGLLRRRRRHLRRGIKADFSPVSEVGERHRLKACATCVPGNDYRVFRPTPLVRLARTRSTMTLSPSSNL